MTGLDLYTPLWNYIECSTRYWTRHFFNNFTTNKDIATKFEADYRHTLQTHSFSFLTQGTNSCNIFIGVRIITEMPGSVASGTHCTKSKIRQKFVFPSSLFTLKFRYALRVSNLCPILLKTIVFFFKLFSVKYLVMAANGAEACSKSKDHPATGRGDPQGSG